jgi:hypothetical protein
MLSVVAVALVFGVVANVEAVNLISNGDFSAGLDDWIVLPPLPVGDVGVEVVPDHPSGPAAVLGINRSAHLFPQSLSQPFTIGPGIPAVDLAFDYFFDRSTLWNLDLPSDTFAVGILDLPLDFLYVNSYELGPGPLGGLAAHGRLEVRVDTTSVTPGELLALTFLIDEDFVGRFFRPDWTDSKVYIDNVELHPVPEPTTLLLIGVGLLGLVAIRRKSLKK